MAEAFAATRAGERRRELVEVLDVARRSATSRSARSREKPLRIDDPQRGEVLAVLRERVRGHQPAAVTQPLGHVEHRVGPLVVVERERRTPGARCRR